MRPLSELVNESDSGLPMVLEMAGTIHGRCLVLPPSADCGDALFQTQVTTRSPMGAIVYHTGGILVDGWLRILGSGSERIPRSLPKWNRDRSSGFYLVADDVVGGFFAIDGGGLGYSQGQVCYWAPDSLEWLCLKWGYSDFLHWAMTQDLEAIYEELRWPQWREEVAQISGDSCLAFYPFLWTQEGSVERSVRRPVPVWEAFDAKVDMVRQLAGGGTSV